MNRTRRRVKFSAAGKNGAYFFEAAALHIYVRLIVLGLSDGWNRRYQKCLPSRCGAERLSSFSIALNNDGTPSSLPTTLRIPIRLAACSSSSVLNSVNITIGISGKALNIPSAATRPSEYLEPYRIFQS